MKLHQLNKKPFSSFEQCYENNKMSIKLKIHHFRILLLLEGICSISWEHFSLSVEQSKHFSAFEMGYNVLWCTSCIESFHYGGFQTKIMSYMELESVRDNIDFLKCMCLLYAVFLHYVGSEPVVRKILLQVLYIWLKIPQYLFDQKKLFFSG